jgi:hypothetical protein
MMMLHGAPRTGISADLLITRYLLWIEQFARFEMRGEMRGEMNRTQPALNLRDGLGLGGEQVRSNLLLCKQLVERLFVLDQFRAERLGRCVALPIVVLLVKEGHEALRVAECLYTISFGQARSRVG